MKAKSLILIMIALGCGLVASIGISQVMVRGGDSEPAQPETEKILVAMKLIDIAEPLSADNVKLEEWPKNLIPRGAITSMEEIKDKYCKSRVVQGQAILKDMLVDEKTGIVPTIPEGYRVTSIKVSMDEALSGLLQPGDRVDISGYFRRGNEPIVVTFLHDVQVFAVNEKTERIIDPEGKALMAKTVSLLVTPEQVQKILVAKQSGNLHLSLRSYTDETAGPSTPITLSDVINEPSERGSEPWDDPDKPAEQQQSQNSFKSWLDRLKQSQQSPLAAMPIVPAPQPQKQAQRIVMVVHTPEGIKQYTWTDPNELPEVTEYTGAPSAPPAAAEPAAAAAAPPTDQAAPPPDGSGQQEQQPTDEQEMRKRNPEIEVGCLRSDDGMLAGQRAMRAASTARWLCPPRTFGRHKTGGIAPRSEGSSGGAARRSVGRRPARRWTNRLVRRG